MRALIKEATEVLNSAVASPAIYSLMKSYDGGLRLHKTGPVRFTHDSFLTAIAVHCVRETLHVDAKCHKIEISGSLIEDLATNVRSDIRTTISRVLRDYQDVKSPKTTALYRWYNEFLNTGRLRDNEEMDNDFFNVYKWIKTSKENPNTKAIISILEVLKQRYEVQGMKL